MWDLTIAWAALLSPLCWPPLLLLLLLLLVVFPFPEVMTRAMAVTPLSTVNTRDKHTANSTTGPLGPIHPHPPPSPSSPARQLLFKYTKHATGQFNVSECLGLDMKSYYCFCLRATDVNVTTALRILHKKHQDPPKLQLFNC